MGYTDDILERLKRIEDRVFAPTRDEINDRIIADGQRRIAELEGLLREYFNHFHDEAPLADDIGVRAAKALQKSLNK